MEFGPPLPQVPIIEGDSDSDTDDELADYRRDFPYGINLQDYRRTPTVGESHGGISDSGPFSLHLDNEIELATRLVSGSGPVTYSASESQAANLHARIDSLREAQRQAMAPAPEETASKPKESTATKPFKTKKKKILLMGKSGSGKSSMRSIIFSNYVAKDVRRLGATIDVEHSRVKFLGNLVLNLWDCGGQDAFTENYLNAQRQYVFSDVGVLIYVFDIESREFERDLATYNAIVKALHEFSPSAAVFCLIHKMDLVKADYRDRIYQERAGAVREKSEGFEQTVQTYPTSIWDQSLYKAWGNIVHSLIPNLEVIEAYLKNLAGIIRAEEIILFERTTFLTVTSFTSEAGAKNPYPDRFERLSNIIKTFKHSLAKNTSSSTSSQPFDEFTIKSARFNLLIMRFTSNTYVLLVFPPGEATLNCTRLNVQVARNTFAVLNITGEKGKERGESMSDGATDTVPDEGTDTVPQQEKHNDDEAKAVDGGTAGEGGGVENGLATLRMSSD